ncbi:MAG: endonuclease V [Deltaproteobacteria bacterium]
MINLGRAAEFPHHNHQRSLEHSMIAALDVHYDDSRSRATGAAVLFENWDAAVPTAEYTGDVENVQPYVPGEFFRRELPCLLALIARIQEPVDLLIIDGYVQLGDRPGLGHVLWERLSKTKPVIGVAKSRFEGAAAVEVIRGDSKTPLFVTAIGIDPAEAASDIRRMHGPYRIPTLLKRVDRLARRR